MTETLRGHNGCIDYYDIIEACLICSHKPLCPSTVTPTVAHTSHTTQSTSLSQKSVRSAAYSRVSSSVSFYLRSGIASLAPAASQHPTKAERRSKISAPPRAKSETRKNSEYTQICNDLGIPGTYAIAGFSAVLGEDSLSPLEFTLRIVFHT